MAFGVANLLSGLLTLRKVPIASGLRAAALNSYSGVCTMVDAVNHQQAAKRTSESLLEPGDAKPPSSPGRSGFVFTVLYDSRRPHVRTSMCTIK